MNLVNGFFYPQVTIGLLGLYYTGRYFYTIGYYENAGVMDKQRVAGTIMVNISKLATFGVFMLISTKLIKGRPLI